MEHHKTPAGYFCYLRYLLIFLVFCIICNSSYGQTFNAKGYFVPANSGKMYATALKSAPPNVKPDADMVASYKKQLLSRVNAAIYSLQDDSLALVKTYKQLWGSEFYKTLLGELKCLKANLTGKAVPGAPSVCTYNWVPDPKDINVLSSFDLYEIKPDAAYDTKTQKVYNLIKKDLLQDYLVTKYNATLTGAIQVQEIDNEYINDWRQIEAWYAQAIQTREIARKMSDDIFSYSQEKVIKLDQNLTAIDPATLTLATTIKNSDFLKKWLWYSNAIPTLNPLLVTTSEKNFPATEKNTFFTAAKQKEQDLLNTQNILEKFRTTAKYRNRLFLPVANADDKDKYLLLEYDRSPSPTATIGITENTLDNALKLRIGLYNIPNKDKINYTDGKEALVFESSFIQKAGPVFDQVGAITSLASTNIAAFAKVSGLLNNKALTLVQLAVAAPAPAVAADPMQNMKFMNFYLQRQEEADTTRAKEPVKDKPEPQDKVYVNGHWVPLTVKDRNEDKKRIIWIGAVETGTNLLDSPNPFFDQLLAEFIKEDNYYFIDYSDLDAEVTNLKDRFNKFQGVITQRLKNLKSLADNADVKIEQTGAYVRISNRSLPPQDLKSITDTVPDLKTILIYPKVPDAPQKYNFSLTEQSSVATDKDIPKPIADQSLKVIQTLRFDFSVGLAYTTSNYYIAADAQPLPTIALGDQFQFTAGLHYYFWNPLNRLHVRAFAKVKERFSLYAGLSIQHALDNYFGGLSYDVVPGVRLIGGTHFYKNYHYTIINNTVADKASGINSGKFFISLNLEPILLTKALGLFK